MKLFRSETTGLHITDEEVRKEYQRRNQKVQVSYVLIDPKAFTKDVAVDDTILKAYYDSHREEFLAPDSVKVSYVTAPIADKATDKDKAAARAKALEVYQRLARNSDIAEAAKAVGLAVKETGFFSMEQPDILIIISCGFLS